MPRLRTQIACLVLALLATPALAQEHPQRQLVSRLASSPAERAKILRELDPEFSDPRLPRLLEETFERGDFEVRLWAARHLFARADEQALPWLDLQRRVGDRETYDHATETLGLYAGPKHRARLAEALIKAREPWGHEVVALVGGLLRVGGPVERTLAAEAVSSASPRARARFWELLGEDSSRLRRVPGRHLRAFVEAAPVRGSSNEFRQGARTLLASAGEGGVRHVAGWLRAEDSPRGVAALQVVRDAPTRAAQAALASAILQASPQRLRRLQALALELGARATPALLASLARTGKASYAKRHLAQGFLSRNPAPEDWRALGELLERPGELRATVLRLAACRKEELPAQTLLLVGAADRDPTLRGLAQAALGTCALDPRALREALPRLAASAERSAALAKRVGAVRPEVVAYVFLQAAEFEHRLSKDDVLRLGRTLGVIPAGLPEPEALRLLEERIRSLR